MVLYFTSNAVSPPALIYMGRDKFENEDLIKYGWDEDVWFHVDKLSSAHVYVRLPPGMAWDAMPPALVDDCAQLTKANSIVGNKEKNLTIIYTPWSNLKKSGDMATGQVTFHNPRLVKRCHVAERENAIVNRLNKTKEERQPDLGAERRERDRLALVRKKDAERAKAKEDKRLEEERRKLKEAKSYAKVFEGAEMTSNRDVLARKMAAKKSRAESGEDDADDFYDEDDDDDDFM